MNTVDIMKDKRQFTNDHPGLSSKRALISVATFVTIIFLSQFFGCSDSSSPDTKTWISITQPADGAVISDSVVRIITEISTDCGCQAHVEFYIDGSHVSSDFLPVYSFDWDVRGLSGEFDISARVVVNSSNDAWDSIRVSITEDVDSIPGFGSDPNY